jgi:cytokinin riboside 5'-monophosphate phosphoribohydrolase
MTKTICVFCSSSNTVAPEFFVAANELGEQIAKRGYKLVFGGTNVGLMGEIARAVHRHGGHVIGIMPKAFSAQNIAYTPADELIITADLRERKAAMEARADAFITMPGGFGTLEEVLEILTLKQLQFHNKPVVLLNTVGFYDHLVQFFQRLGEEHFIKAVATPLYHVAPDAIAALDYIDSYEYVDTPGTWF